jgi:8-oxo-dGTP diphosphatase
MNFPKIGIGILMFDDSNQILLGQRLNSHGAYSWAPPGGHLEFGESLEDCAIREVKEETGLIINNLKLIGITNDIFREENKHYVSLFFRALYPYKQFIKNNEPNKVISWEWFQIQNLPDSIFLPLKNLLHSNAKILFDSQEVQ